MRRILAATAVVLLLAPLAPATAWAQTRLQQPAAQPPGSPSLTASQSQLGSPNQLAGAQSGADAAALLVLYMRQLANAGQAPSQADVNEAARQYFTNGAAVSTVPTSGPGAAYYQNGAAAVSYYGVPTSATAPAPTAAANQTPTPYPYPAPNAAPVPGTVGGSPYPVPVPVPVATDNTAPAPAPTEDTSGGASPQDNQPSGVTEAQGAAPAAAGAPVQPLVQTIYVTPPPAAPAPAPASVIYETETAARCPPPPSFLSSRIAPAFAGLLFGGLAVALWTRPRMIRDRRVSPSR